VSEEVKTKTAGPLTKWQSEVVVEYQTVIEAASTTENLEAVAVEVALSRQEWLRRSAWPIVRRKQQELGIADPSQILIIVDAMNWIRADFSINGDEDQCVEHFMRRLRSNFSRMRGKWIAVVADSAEQLERKKICREYKSTRGDRPEEIESAARKIRNACNHMQIPWLVCDGWEADDCAATLSLRCMCRGGRSVICSNDRDYMQIVSKDVVLHTKGDYITAQRVEESLGVPCNLVVEYLTLIGKDDLPHPDGIGPKTAADLLKQYGDFIGIYDHRHAFTDKKREAIESFAPHYWRVRECHKLNRDLKLTFDWASSPCLA